MIASIVGSVEPGALLDSLRSSLGVDDLVAPLFIKEGMDQPEPVVSMPAGVLAGVLRLARWLRLGRYGPEQVDFLRYRPVLSNRRLQEEFGYRPAKTSAEAFDTWVEGARARGMR